MEVVTARFEPSIARCSALSDLRDVVLLAGSVRSRGLRAEIGRPVFELPLGNGRTILDAWRVHAAKLAAHHGAALTLRVLVNRGSPEGQVRDCADVAGMAAVRIQSDPFEYRGTGGALRDLAAEYEDEDILLVANAGQLLTAPLPDLVDTLAAASADVSLFSHGDGTPSGMFLVRCGALRQIPDAGFVDFKEQALPAIARSRKVSVVQRHQATALSIRTLADYIGALRHHQKAGNCSMNALGVFAEDWEPAFGIVERTAQVQAEVRLHDSVVLSGARVEAGAVVVRSVVCSGGFVGPNELIVDQIVSTRGRNGGRS